MTLFAASQIIVIVPPNQIPQWSGTMTPSWTAGVGGTFALANHASDADGDTLTYSHDAASTAMPSWLSLNTSSGLLTASTDATEGSTINIRFKVDDGTAAAVASPNITITVLASGTGKKWHPGHYLKVQGKPTQVDQAGWQTSIIRDLDNYVDDDVLILGAHIGFGWGALNPTGSLYDWDIVYAVLNRLATSDKYLLAQIQSKNFSANKGLEAPADLTDQIIQTNTGWTATLWRDGTGGFPDVMGRYITFWKAFIAEFDSHPNMEIFVPTESSPSLGSSAPGDFTTGQYGTQLRRMYDAVAPDAVKTNIAANINNLGTNQNDEVPSLLETAFQADMMHATPDAKPTVGYNAFKGVATYSVAVTRDYSAEPMGCLEVYSNDVAVQGGGEEPEDTINDEQEHGTTHLSWIPSKTGSKSWASILVAINADPLLTSTCPVKYSACDT